MAGEEPIQSGAGPRGRGEPGPIKLSRDWVERLSDELGLDVPVDVLDLLDLARDSAHRVARPAAPLTTFLVGYAAAARGGGPGAVADAARTVRRVLAGMTPVDVEP